MRTQSLLLGLATASSIVAAAPLDERFVADAYQPVQTSCPSSALIRPASGINRKEEIYITSRKAKADEGLSEWLKKQGSFDTSFLPTVGIASSGGGYRALLCTAGVIQALDGRDTDLETGGLYQGLTYESGLSGGSWFLSSLAGNNWPTISYLRDNLWGDAFQKGILEPENLLSISSLAEYTAVSADVLSKGHAGYDTTIVDPYGRLLSYQLLEGFDGGVNTRLSGLTSLSNFTSLNVPYPIITVRGVDGSHGQCFPDVNSPQYEFHPYEYGSWDDGIAAFADSQYMGSNLTNGKSLTGKCTVHYDNLGYVFGTSSDVFNGACTIVPASNSSLEGALETLLDHSPVVQDLFAVYPNPFYHYPHASTVQNDYLLTLSDGGEAGQNVPIWPLIQPARAIDILILNDNSADTSDNFPNGTEIHQTYLNAQVANLSKMPYIPDVATFVTEGLNKRATFFGCNDSTSAFVIYLPNVNYIYASNTPTFKLQYEKAETDGMIANGNAVAMQNGTEGWPFCLACGIMNLADGLPDGCDACFERYCYRQ
ncbi:lysophospholipase [Acrodontium crateriforme]|uniref:Lysophospholipase n=1 Tax=Acrodontium crateriforme TaxID=150365 RepID=A0AAQ3M6G9_9PEZI|nr:lysophospholipase [Acrodontium crateriforme]